MLLNSAHDANGGLLDSGGLDEEDLRPRLEDADFGELPDLTYAPPPAEGLAAQGLAAAGGETGRTGVRPR